MNEYIKKPTPEQIGGRNFKKNTTPKLNAVKQKAKTHQKLREWARQVVVDEKQAQQSRHYGTWDEEPVQNQQQHHATWGEILIFCSIMILLVIFVILSLLFGGKIG